VASERNDEAGGGETAGSPDRPGHMGLPESRHDPAVARLVTALRRVQDRVIGTAAPTGTMTAAAELLERAAAELDPYRMTGTEPPSWGDLRRTSGTRALAPPLVDLRCTAQELDARVTFGAFHVGGNGAAHGGTIPLLFDEVLGRLANVGRPMSRTANLSVDYRRVTPVGRELRVHARVEKEEGRKRFLYGQLLDGEQVTAEVHALFVALRPGQA
jgi:acyl-coenzyme A thioesterase PaaI-like protein